MRGLLDFFRPQPQGGILGQDVVANPQEEQRKAMMQYGLLGAGANMLANSGYSTTPVSTGQILGHGLQGFQQGEQLGKDLTKPQDPIKLGAGDVLIDPFTKKPVYSAPRAPVSVGAGGTLVDPQTGQTVFTSPNRPVSVPPGGTLVDPVSGKTVYKDAGFGGTSPTQQTSLSGGDYLNSLPPERANVVKGMIEGRIPYPGAYALKNPAMQQLVSDAMRVDPEYDYATAQKRAKAQKDFGTGQLGSTVASLNTAIGHLKELKDASDNLHNSNKHIPGVTIYNSAKNALSKMSGENNITNFDTVVNRVVPEIANAYVKGGGTGKERGADKGDFQSNMTKDQLYGTIQETGKLLSSKINALTKQYRDSMGSFAQEKNFLSPESQSVLNEIGVDTQGLGQVGEENIPTGTNMNLPSISREEAITELKRRGHRL